MDSHSRQNKTRIRKCQWTSVINRHPISAAHSQFEERPEDRRRSVPVTRVKVKPMPSAIVGRNAFSRSAERRRSRLSKAHRTWSTQALPHDLAASIF
jgi:hypothetical protein